MTGATVGKVAVAQQGIMLLNQRVGLIRATGVDQQYLQLTLMSDDFYNFCQRTAGGGAQGNISPDQISTYEIYFPSFEEQKRIVAQLESEQSLIDANKKLIDIYTQKIKAKIAEVWGE
jgi:restriction endonuclease S subunit